MTDWHNEKVKAALASPRAMSLLAELMLSLDDKDETRIREIHEEILNDRSIMFSLLVFCTSFVANTGLSSEHLMIWGLGMAHPFVERN